MVSRRNMLKTGLTAVFGACAVQTASASEVQQKSQNNFDVVILGAGTGGLVTAIEAADLGLKPVVLEKMECSAGNSLYASGGIAAWGTSQQKEEGRNETKESFREDMMKVSEYRADPALVGAYVNHIPEDKKKKKKQGVKFSKIGKKPWPLNYRMHNVDGQGLTGGARLVRYLLEACEKRNIPIIYNTKAIELLTNDAGRVIGVRAQGDLHKTDYFAKDGVVIATGGFSANEEMRVMYMGPWAARLNLRGSLRNTGENILMTRPLGAKLVNMTEFYAGPIVPETHANPARISNSAYGMIVGKDGKRCVDESLGQAIRSKLLPQVTPDNRTFIICDIKTNDEDNILTKLLDRFHRLNSPVYEANSIPELAKKAGINEKNLVASVKEFNDAIAKGKGAQLNPPHNRKRPHPVSTAPFYAIPMSGGIAATFGGPRINEHGQVVDLDDVPIKGLYAAGNAAGGLWYAEDIPGCQITSGIAMGRIAARHAINGK